MKIISCKNYIFFAFVIFFPLITNASESSGTIESGSFSARICKNTTCTLYGSVNWKPTGSTPVQIADSGLSGYVWGSEIGFINLNPTSAGVSINSSTGALSGHAFSNTGSWINFNPSDVSGGTDVGVSINTSGEFVGWAWVSGVNGGWMKFDCSSVNTCVKTDWRPLGSRTSSGGQTSGGVVAGGSQSSYTQSNTPIQTPSIAIAPTSTYTTNEETLYQPSINTENQNITNSQDFESEPNNTSPAMNGGGAQIKNNKGSSTAVTAIDSKITSKTITKSFIESIRDDILKNPGQYLAICGGVLLVLILLIWLLRLRIFK